MMKFDRLPKAYRNVCREIASTLPPRILGGLRGSKTWTVAISAKNRNVRIEADRRIAAEKVFPNIVTRQQRRFAARHA